MNDILNGKPIAMINSDFDFNTQRQFFYRYMPLSRLLDIFNNKQLTFVYSGEWTDPFEKRYLETDFSCFI